jgi:hypothetical protein
MKDTAWHVEYQRKRYSERLERAIAYLGGTCVECGSTADLQFDHKDRETKVFNVTRMLSKYSWAKITEELDKCQLLCRSHHIDKSLAERGQARRIKQDL